MKRFVFIALLLGLGCEFSPRQHQAKVEDCSSKCRASGAKFIVYLPNGDNRCGCVVDLKPEPPPPPECQSYCPTRREQ